jgi:O-antigen ligase
MAMPLILRGNTASAVFDRIQDNTPVNDRLNLYTVYLNMFKDHPFIGVGFDRFMQAALDYYGDVNSVFFRHAGMAPHDTFANILAEMGIMGAGLILCVYISILLKSVRLYRRGPDTRNIAIVFWGFIIVYMVNSFFIEMRYFEFINSVFFIFAGVVCVIERQLGKRL